MSQPMPRNAIIAVAGVSYRQDAVRCVEEGDAASLVADPSNAHDANAIAVVSSDGKLLGYVPASLTPRLHATGCAAHRAVVTEVLRGDTWGLRVRYVGPADEEIEAPGHVPDAVGAPDGASRVGDAAGGPASADDVERIVRTRSGRVLGRFVAVEGKVTKVAVDGGVVPYPSAVVEVVEADAAAA